MSRAKKQVRQRFRDQVFERDGGLCVNCKEPAVDAHHILPREAFADGGYYRDNGVSLCAGCHVAAEAGDITPAQLREQAGISAPVVPDP